MVLGGSLLTGCGSMMLMEVLKVPCFLGLLLCVVTASILDVEALLGTLNSIFLDGQG